MYPSPLIIFLSLGTWVKLMKTIRDNGRNTDHPIEPLAIYPYYNSLLLTYLLKRNPFWYLIFSVKRNSFQFSKTNLFISSFLQKMTLFLSKSFLSFVFFFEIMFWFCKCMNRSKTKLQESKTKMYSELKSSHCNYHTVL